MGFGTRALAQKIDWRVEIRYLVNVYGTVSFIGAAVLSAGVLGSRLHLSVLLTVALVLSSLLVSIYVLILFSMRQLRRKSIAANPLPARSRVGVLVAPVIVRGAFLFGTLYLFVNALRAEIVGHWQHPSSFVSACIFVAINMFYVVLSLSSLRKTLRTTTN